MKSKRISYNQTLKLLVLRPLFLVVWVLLCNAAMAQQVTTVDAGANSREQVKEYLEKNKNTPLVKLYHNNPKDVVAANALKLSILLDNPKHHDRYKPDELLRMKNELKGLMEQVTFIDQKVNEGNSYEKATMLNERKQTTIKSQERPNPAEKKHTPANETAPGTPVLTVPNQ